MIFGKPSRILWEVCKNWCQGRLLNHRLLGSDTVRYALLSLFTQEAIHRFLETHKKWEGDYIFWNILYIFWNKVNIKRDSLNMPITPPSWCPKLFIKPNFSWIMTAWRNPPNTMTCKGCHKRCWKSRKGLNQTLPKEFVHSVGVLALSGQWKPV